MPVERSVASPEHKQLQQSLTRLHAELASAPRIDPASKKLLREVLADIERVLHEPPRASAEVRHKAEHPAGPSAPKLEALAIEFEAEHPTIAGSLRQLVDLLGRAGL